MTQAEQTSGNDFVLDAVDQGILQLLRLDGRMAFSEIAKRLDIPETTARYRVQRLIQSKMIQVTAWPNLEKMGKPHVLILQMIVANGWIDEVAKQLAEMEEVRFVALTTGRYNIAVDICFGAHTDLLAFFDKLRPIQGILSYESQTVLKLLKAEYQYVIHS